MAIVSSETKKITLEVPLEIHEALVASAQRDRRSLKQQAAWLLERAIEAAERERAKGSADNGLDRNGL